VSEERVVVLRAAGWSPIQAVGRGGSFPTASYGSRCACCDAETDLRLKFNPSTGWAATPIAIPACTDCLPHIQRTNPVAAGMLALVSLVFFAIAYTNAAWWALGGLACLAGAGAIHLSARRRHAAMIATGHHVGLQIVAIPGLVQVRTTNPRFADEVRTRNPDLAKPAA
jgi:hypothetical protein